MRTAFRIVFSFYVLQLNRTRVRNRSAKLLYWQSIPPVSTNNL